MGFLIIGQAAEMYGVHKLEFIEELGRRKIPVVFMEDDEI